MQRLSSTTTICAALLLSTAAPGLAQAQRQFQFAVPAESLSQALRDVAVQTGRNVVAPDNLVQARQAPALSGTFTADQAVARLLSGTGLEVRPVGNALVVSVAPTADGAGSTVGAKNREPAITVTGTRIRGAGSASPVIVNTRADLEQAGINDLAEFTRVLPQNYAGGQNRGIPGGGEQGGQQNLNDSANLNLRGLGSDATLTLLNGHRLSYDALDQGVDISAIPLGAIERVEVVSDGASALYGSDAVAGVANIILRRDYDGLETTARVGGATDGGDFEQEYSLVGGRRWSTGGFMLTLDHSSASPITANQRNYTRDLDPSLYLADRIRQASGVLTFHQQLAPGLSFDVDGTAMNRYSVLQSPFTATEDVHVDGLVSGEHVRSYSLTPTLRAALGPWQASLSATAGDSRTLLDTSNYYSGVPQVGRLLYEDNVKGAEVTAEGPLFTLPGGAARLAVGGGLRTIRLHDRFRDLVSDQWVTSQNFTEQRDVRFAYGEISLPLVGPDLDIPMVNRLTLSGALRHEHWNTIASVTTPKLGAIYQPTPDITLRATWGKSFKIPTLYQVTQIEAGYLIPGFIFSPLPQPPGAPVLLLGGSAPNLKPERATTWSGTFELKPRLVPGLALRATYFLVDYRDRIATPIPSVLSALTNPLYDNFITYDPTAAQVNALIAALPGGLVNETGAPFDPSGVGAIIDQSSRNTERQLIHGVDMDGDYRIDLGANQSLRLSGAASYLVSRQQLSVGQPFLQLAGTLFHPVHWRGRAGVSWDTRRTGLSAFVNYVGPSIDNTFTTLERIGSFTTLDLNANFKLDGGSGILRNVELHLSALNVLNQKPHLIRVVYPEEAAYDSTNESAVGRFIGASIRKAW